MDKDGKSEGMLEGSEDCVGSSEGRLVGRALIEGALDIVGCSVGKDPGDPIMILGLFAPFSNSRLRNVTLP